MADPNPVDSVGGIDPLSTSSSAPEPTGSDPWTRFPVANERRVAVRMADGARRWIRSGHPWLFDDSIVSATDGGEVGDLAVVFDQKRRFQAIGLFDPSSPIRVRVLHHGDPVPIDDAWWTQRLDEIVERRRRLLESTDTTGLRIVNGENDGLPGLVADLYDRVMVVKIYTPAWFAHLRTVVPLLRERVDADTVVLRLSRRCQREAPPGISEGMALIGVAPTEPIRFRENGLIVEADVIAGQKTGYFLDQRDNRRRVGEQSRGANVLDVFSAGGGFTLAAAAGDARSVVSVDISEPALAASRRNLELNRDLEAVQRCRHDTRRGDAFEIMAELAEQRRRYDVVIVDPPSFAQKEASVPGALRAYARLTDLAVRLVADGGLLVQASCSSRIGPEEFHDTVERAANQAGVGFDVVRRTGHPSDHPIGFPEGGYLKAVFARVHRR